ncbi:MAG: hypothetical protein JNK15_21740 [Planctomycetes bacterium]|nr:hypothetical protein [Planctomycetota bacterium]
MRLHLVVAASLLGLTGCGGGADAGVRRIEGGRELRFRGVAFDVPATWRSEDRGDGIVLVPANANGSGVLEEVYLVSGDAGIRSLDDPAAEGSVLQAVAQIQAGARKERGPEAATFGGLVGRRWVFTGVAEGGRAVEIRVHAFVGQHACAITACGFPETLRRREADLAAILGSLRVPAAVASAGGGGDVDARTELAGQWIWMANFQANGGGGRQSNTSLTLGADGRYQRHYDSVSDNPNGAAWGSQDEAGTWSVAGGSISFAPDGGMPYAQQLVKQNHPQNTNDPMLVLDGKPYVTASPRRPW